MNTPFTIEPQTPPRALGLVLPAQRVNPTLYEPQTTYSASLTNPCRVRLYDVWWLLDHGYAMRADSFGFSGNCLDENSHEAANRYYLYRHLLRVPNITRVAHIERVDSLLRMAFCDNGEHHPTDVVLEILLSLAGRGSVAYAIVDVDGHAAYRVHDCVGIVTAIVPWTPEYQVWLDERR